MPGKLQSALSLSPRQWQLFICSWYSLWNWDRTLRRKPYSEWRHTIVDLSPKPVHSTPLSLQQSRAIATLIRLNEAAARNHFIKVNCLRRCLSQQELLAREGFIAQLHFGVRRKGDSLDAHCWLSLHGNVINDSAENIASYNELEDSEACIRQLSR